jgi:hypothetical protein
MNLGEIAFKHDGKIAWPKFRKILVFVVPAA